MSTSPTCIVAYIHEPGRHDGVREAAIDAARASTARLILYDASAASRLSSPTPTWWSGDRPDAAKTELLNADDLDASGREALAEVVRGARVAGVDAYAWLPSSPGADALAEYAESQGADLLFVPEDLDHRSMMARLRGEPTSAQVAEKATLAVITIPAPVPA